MQTIKGHSVQFDFASPAENAGVYQITMRVIGCSSVTEAIIQAQYELRGLVFESEPKSVRCVADTWYL